MSKVHHIKFPGDVDYREVVDQQGRLDTAALDERLTVQ